MKYSHLNCSKRTTVKIARCAIRSKTICNSFYSNFKYYQMETHKHANARICWKWLAFIIFPPFLINHYIYIYIHVITKPCGGICVCILLYSEKFRFRGARARTQNYLGLRFRTTGRKRRRRPYKSLFSCIHRLWTSPRICITHDRLIDRLMRAFDENRNF